MQWLLVSSIFMSMATSFFYIYVLATSFFSFYVMATSFGSYTLHVQLGSGWDVFQNGWDGSQPLRCFELNMPQCQFQYFQMPDFAEISALNFAMFPHSTVNLQNRLQ